jgi:hypothetical protein
MAVAEQKGKVLEDARYKHLMALSLDEKSGYQQGLIRCIASRSGDVEECGYIDRSVLHHVSLDGNGKFIIGEKLKIKKIKCKFISATPKEKICRI